MTKSTKQYHKEIEGRICKAALEAAQFHPDNSEAVGVMLVALGMNPELEFLAGEALRKKAMHFLAEARGGGRDVPDAQRARAPATPLAGADDKGQTSDDTQRGSAPSVPAPRPRQVKHHAVVTEVIAKSLFDEFKFTLRQGSKMPVGDFHFSSLARFVKHGTKRTWVSEMETRVASSILSWGSKQAHIPKDALVRDVLDLKTLEAFIDQATTAADIKAKLIYRPDQDNPEQPYA